MRQVKRGSVQERGCTAGHAARGRWAGSKQQPHQGLPRAAGRRQVEGHEHREGQRMQSRVQSARAWMQAHEKQQREACKTRGTRVSAA